MSKTPKGTRDFLPAQMVLRDAIFSKITTIFKRHGAVTIDTPVFELKETLLGKYGEDTKLIYDLADQGGEILALRYDLTVPFSRFIEMHGFTNIKRYHIGKSYRRDNPSINKGRMREFYQCDFDIAGEYGSMIPDSLALKILVNCLDDLSFGKFKVKVNHRKILDGIFEVCGVPLEKIRTISAAVDKLDKTPWIDVKQEMIQKGLNSEAADLIHRYVSLVGSSEICEVLAKIPELAASPRAMEGVQEMRQLFKYLDIYGVSDKMSFDLSLARGLDYYTGVIFEAIYEADSEETSGVGSIGAGGRYDNLVGMNSATGKQIPCVGCSIGVERVFAILEAKQRNGLMSKQRTTATQVYLIGLGNGQLKDRMKAASLLWSAGIAADFTYKEKPHRDTQFKLVADEGIPVTVVFNDNKFCTGFVELVDNVSGVKKNVDVNTIVDEVKKVLGSTD
ncbi:hypothetical protein HDU79_009915 [Rhizoclosmatium sp. JEL0117]|nr:hypothetical protein HDU79_009915 [Rhizoclosmatium sp. JEL0117]